MKVLEMKPGNVDSSRNGSTSSVWFDKGVVWVEV